MPYPANDSLKATAGGTLAARISMSDRLAGLAVLFAAVSAAAGLFVSDLYP